MLFISLLCLVVNSWGNLLVLEYKDGKDSLEHLNRVSDIACKNLEEVCDSIYFSEFTEEALIEVKKATSDSRVVNMSFGFQMQEHRYSPPHVKNRANFVELRADFDFKKNLAKGIVTDNPETLFVVAAGNGDLLAPVSTGATPIGDFLEVAPATFDLANLWTVGAIDTDHVDLSKLEEYKMADYANYSVYEVDFAAQVPRKKNQDLQNGTSFSTPFIANLAYQILEKHRDQISLVALKEIFIKSSYVKGIDQAIDLSINPEKMKLVHDYAYFSEFPKFQEKVILVRSGGYVVKEVAILCADLYTEAKGVLSVENACLEAQEEILQVDHLRQQKLKKLWKLRSL